jgi:hypothetical protein
LEHGSKVSNLDGKSHRKNLLFNVKIEIPTF